MSSPSSSTRPVIHPSSESSCIRLMVRRKVDLPQPDGPISACTRLVSKPSETPFTAVSLSVSIRIVAVWGGRWTGTVRSAASAIEVEPPSDREPCPDAQDEDDQDEDQRGGPGVLVPFLVGAGGVGEHRERERRHRLVQVEAEILAPQRREEQRGGFPGDARHRQKTAG